jgi:hypothetical protein
VPHQRLASRRAHLDDVSERGEVTCSWRRLAVLQICHAGGVAGNGSVINVSRRWCRWYWQCYKCVTQVVSLVLTVLHRCHAGGVAGTGSATNVSRRWCRWYWQCYKCVTQVVSLVLAVLHRCHAGRTLMKFPSAESDLLMADVGSVTDVSRMWCCWYWQCCTDVMQVVSLVLAVLQMCHAGGVAGTNSVAQMSRRWCRWYWQCYTDVMQVVSLVLAVLQMCHAGGVAGTNSVAQMSCRTHLDEVSERGKRLVDGGRW